MTHDEFLAALGDYDVPSINALRAVVELHKPHLFAIDEIKCLNCQFYYPCPTIQAIEKEIK